jgi:hypothetical protein
MDDFWGFYLREHSRRSTRVMHYIGTTLAAGFLVASIVLANPWLLLAALFSGYLFAWLGHMLFEHNRPATFKHPLRSFAADWKMWALGMTGQLGKHLQRHVVAKQS